ncbi:MAG: hypothetical protein L6W00_27620 [Lentisphaeria bacterium]|nr:MAG: hypothetical protein L6W00_27620 [Lentisphaeria bacterium]
MLTDREVKEGIPCQHPVKPFFRSELHRVTPVKNRAGRVPARQFQQLAGEIHPGHPESPVEQHPRLAPPAASQF